MDSKTTRCCSSTGNKKGNKLQKDFMDLDYPSEKKHELSHQLNEMDQRYGSIILSNPKIISPLKPLPTKTQKKILAAISDDQSEKLLQHLSAKTVTMAHEMSKEKHGWTILHCIAKQNAHQCMDVSLRWIYQTNASEYEECLNKKNCDGDSPLMMACIYKSNDVIRTMLQFGLVDIYGLNGKKLSAYQIALNSSNEEALQMLMKYEVKIKRKNFINREALSQPLPKIDNRPFKKMCQCFVECFTFGFLPSQIDKESETDRNMKMDLRQEVTNIEIEWYPPEKMYGKKVGLFSKISKPFQIRQSNVIVSNMLIVFQAFAEHPELLKKVIIPVEDKFCVRLGGQANPKVIWVDNQYPYFVENKQPLFLWLEDQLWPMVLQKALCQIYNGYFEPAKVEVHQLIESISSNQSFIVPLGKDKSDEERKQTIALLEKIQEKNCVMILKENDSCPIRPEQGRIQSFSLLKIIGNKFLVNCPFVVGKQHLNEQKYTIQMKLHMSHYQNPSCTAIWLDEKMFFQYFYEAVYCHTLVIPTLRSNQAKLATSNFRAYITLKLKENYTEEKVFLSFRDKSGKSVAPIKCAGWSLYGQDREHVEKVSADILGIIELNGATLSSEVVLFFEFDEESSQNLNIIQMTCRSEQVINLEPVDCVIGDLQFIECCKKYYRDNYRQYNCPIIQVIGDYVLLMAYSQETCFVPLKGDLSEQNIIEGMMIQSEGRIEMFKYGNICFAVLTYVDEQMLTDLEIMTFDQTEGDEKNINLAARSPLDQI